MIYLFALLFSFNHAYFIKTEQDKFGTRKGDMKLWHYFGFWSRASVLVIAVLALVASRGDTWASIVINPVSMYDFYESIILTISIFGFLCHVMFKEIINAVNKFGFGYLRHGRSDSFLMKSLYAVWLIGTLFFAIVAMSTEF